MTTTEPLTEPVEVWIPSDEQIVRSYLAPFSELLDSLGDFATAAAELDYPIWARAEQMDEARALLATMDRLADMFAAAVASRTATHRDDRQAQAFAHARALMACIFGSERLRFTINGRDEFGAAPFEELTAQLERAKAAAKD